MRTLLFTTGSPFARGVRIILDELGLDYERKEEITTPSVEERASATPTLQVPTLWDGDTILWESGIKQPDVWKFGIGLISHPVIPI